MLKLVNRYVDEMRKNEVSQYTWHYINFFPLLHALGFAVNLQVILANPRALFKRRGAKPGMQESDFLKQITKLEDLEPKARNCTQVSTVSHSTRQKIRNMTKDMWTPGHHTHMWAYAQTVDFEAYNYRIPISLHWNNGVKPAPA